MLHDPLKNLVGLEVCGRESTIPLNQFVLANRKSSTCIGVEGKERKRKKEKTEERERGREGERVYRIR